MAPGRTIVSRKVVLMGRHYSGKSSMKDMIFNNASAMETKQLPHTMNVERADIAFMGNLKLSLMDCGGQNHLINAYLNQPRLHFRKVAMFIYVFNSETVSTSATDLAIYEQLVAALAKYSPNAKVVILLNKIDTVHEKFRNAFIESLQPQIEKRSAHFKARAQSDPTNFQFFATSIWNQSLFDAWISVLHALIPNTNVFTKRLNRLADVIQAREIMLYERTTSLPITLVTKGDEIRNPFFDRKERIANILKQHRQATANHRNIPASLASFSEFTVKTERFIFFIMPLTECLNLAVCIPPFEHLYNSARYTINQQKPGFQLLDSPAYGEGGGGGGGGGEDDDDGGFYYDSDDYPVPDSPEEENPGHHSSAAASGDEADYQEQELLQPKFRLYGRELVMTAPTNESPPLDEQFTEEELQRKRSRRKRGRPSQQYVDDNYESG